MFLHTLMHKPTENTYHNQVSTYRYTHKHTFIINQHTNTDSYKHIKAQSSERWICVLLFRLSLSVSMTLHSRAKVKHIRAVACGDTLEIYTIYTLKMKWFENSLLCTIVHEKSHRVYELYFSVYRFEIRFELLCVVRFCYCWIGKLEERCVSDGNIRRNNTQKVTNSIHTTQTHSTFWNNVARERQNKSDSESVMLEIYTVVRVYCI